MAELGTATWNVGATGPKTVEALKAELTKLAKKKTGKALISTKFTKDHIFVGHTGGPLKMAMALAKLRTTGLSTLMISSMDASAQAEVLNWIKKVPAGKLSLSGTTWTISKSDSTVPMAGSYKFVTADMNALKGMNPDDVVKKRRNWLSESAKTPKLACVFGSDGTPLIYHLDY